MTDLPDTCQCLECRERARAARERFDPHTSETAGPHTKQETYERPKP